MNMSSDDRAPSPLGLPEQHRELHRHSASTHLVASSRTTTTTSEATPTTASAPTTFYGGMVARLELASTHIPSIYITPFCGAMAGVASGIVTCPLDVIKTKLQAQGGFIRRNGIHRTETAHIYRGMIGTGKTIWKNQGIRGLYQGLGPMLLGYLPTWAVYLTVYDKSRAFWATKTGQCRNHY